jgi:nitrogen-specific signal transduction histidine kinase
VNAHDGTVRVTSEPGDTTFIVSLPLVAPTDVIEKGAGSPIPVGDDPQG